MARIDALTKSGTAASARAQGRGPSLLVVHPGGGDLSSWDAVTADLMRDFEVVRLRRRIYLPGAKLSSHAAAVEVEDILAIAAVLEPPILLVGQGSGAAAAFEAALSIPWEFAGLIAYEPLLPTPSEPEVTASTASASEQADLAAVQALGTEIDRYAGLALPITLIAGEQSPAQVQQRIADLAAVLPHAQLVTVPGAAAAAHRETPDLLAAAVRTAAMGLLG